MKTISKILKMFMSLSVCLCFAQGMSNKSDIGDIKLVNSKVITIAKLENSVISSNPLRIKKFQIFLEKKLKESIGVNVKFESYEIKKINNTYILFSYSEGYTSKSLLRVNKNELYFADDSITCTSKACATTNGCLPYDWNTRCTQRSGGDCTKSVTSGLFEELASE